MTDVSGLAKVPRFLNLGAGVDSTALLLASLEGLVERVDAAVFADTGWEPAEVYDHLDALERYSGEAGLPIHRVSHGNLRDDVLDPSVFATIPCFVKLTEAVPWPSAYGRCPSYELAKHVEMESAVNHPIDGLMIAVGGGRGVPTPSGRPRQCNRATKKGTHQ